MQNLIETYQEWEKFDASKKYPSEKFINDLKTNLINEFNFTFEAYYNYKKEFNQKIDCENDDLGKIFSINPKLSDELDEESIEYIDKLVDKNVLLYLSNK